MRKILANVLGIAAVLMGLTACSADEAPASPNDSENTKLEIDEYKTTKPEFTGIDEAFVSSSKAVAFVYEGTLRCRQVLKPASETWYLFTPGNIVASQDNMVFQSGKVNRGYYGSAMSAVNEMGGEAPLALDDLNTAWETYCTENSLNKDLVYSQVPFSMNGAEANYDGQEVHIETLNATDFIYGYEDAAWGETLYVKFVADPSVDTASASFIVGNDWKDCARQMLTKLGAAYPEGFINMGRYKIFFEDIKNQLGL